MMFKFDFLQKKITEQLILDVKMFIFQQRLLGKITFTTEIRKL
jgi:hypothetical protein